MPEKTNKGYVFFDPAACAHVEDDPRRLKIEEAMNKIINALNGFTQNDISDTFAAVNDVIRNCRCDLDPENCTSEELIKK